MVDKVVVCMAKVAESNDAYIIRQNANSVNFTAFESSLNLATILLACQTYCMRSNKNSMPKLKTTIAKQLKY